MQPPASPSQLNHQLGLQLRTLRQQRGWSLDRLAQASGVSKAMLGQMERGESSPTVVTLWKLAAGLQVSLSALLEQQPPQEMAHKHPILYRAADMPASEQLAGGVRVTPLLPFDASLGCELLLVELPAGCEYLSVPHAEGVQEDVIPVAGQLGVWLGGTWHPLGVGDALRFAADQPHGYRNQGDQIARFHNLVHYPTGKPTARPGDGSSLSAVIKKGC